MRVKGAATSAHPFNNPRDIAHACAAPVSVPLAGLSFAPGAGYGVDSDEKNGTKLDVHFAGTLSPQALNLTVGVPWIVDVGTMALREPNAHGGILDEETDGLTVQATLAFGSVFAPAVVLSANGTAVRGPVSDSDADLTIDWSPVQLSFGDDGLLEISLADLTFSKEEPALTQRATFTLLRASGSPGADQRSDVPEPASVALLAAGLAGLGAARRRRR